MDETYIKVRGQRKYRDRVVDIRKGQVCPLTARLDAEPFNALAL